MINRVILMGQLVADPELKTTNTGISVTSFRIAVDRSYVKQGEERQADFFDIVAWRSSAEFVCRNFSKGSLVAVDGQLQSRNYQTKEGQNRTAIEVVADNISFTGERRGTETPSNAPVSNEMTQGGNFTPNAQNGVQRQNPRVYPQSGQVQQPQYQQNYGGAAYDPRYQQGQIESPQDQPLGGYTFDDDLPWDNGGRI